MEGSLKAHWENVYTTKQPHEVSWTQERPETSLQMIVELGLPRIAAIIDIGGGDSRLAECLLDAGYTDITVLDISAKALERAKERMGDKAGRIKWIVSDILDFEPTREYDLWHDRAAFHFLNTPAQVDKYRQVVQNCAFGHLIIGTFSDNGPAKCSGLDVTQYNERSLQKVFEEKFLHLDCRREDHITPFNTTQNFLFCTFWRIAI